MQRESGGSFLWEEVFDSLDDLIFIIDDNCSIIRFNRKASAFFVLNENQPNQKCHNILFNSQHPCDICPKKEPSSKIISCSITKRINIQNRVFSIKTNPIPGSSKESIKHVVLLHNITDEIKAQEEVSAAEEKYRLLAENSSDVILITDASSFRFTYASPSVVNLTGYSANEFIKLHMENVMTGESYERARALYANDKTKGKVTGIYQIVKKDGSLSWVEMAITPLRNEQNKITGYISQSRDINDKKAALDALKVSEERHRLVQENTDIRISYFSVDGKAVFINRASARNLGKNPGNLEGKHFREILTPKLLVQFEKSFQKILNSQKSIDYEDIHENDSAKSYLLITLSRIDDTQGNPKGILVIIKDITELKKAQTEIKEYASRLISLLKISQMNKLSRAEILDHSLEQAIIFTKSKIGFLYLYDETNQKFELHNWSKSVISKCKAQKDKSSCSSNIHALWASPVKQRKPIVINNYKGTPSEKGFLPKGHIGITRYLSVPVFWNDKIVALLSVANKVEDYKENDIHQLQLLMNTVWKIIERNRTEKELIEAKEKAEESDRLKTSFLSNMSHEVRTPINGIMGFLSLIREEQLDPEKKERFFNLIDNNFNHLMTVITNIIDISKLESNQVDLINSDVNLPDLINEVVEVSYSENKLLIGKNISINIEIPIFNNLGYVIQTDHIRLKQILMNLLNNALKFTQEGEIRIGFKLSDNESYLEFYVHDTGIGISKEQQEHIFKRFRQADETTTKKYGGTGLGLSISKHLVELMGGEISVESELNEYSTFTFTLPYIPAIEASEENQKSETLEELWIKERD